MQDILDKFKEYNNIVIFGAGSVANILYCYLNSMLCINNNIEYFIVSCYDGIDRKNNKLVKIFDDVKLELREKIILIAVQNSVQNEIVEILESNNISNYVVIDSNLIINEFYRLLYKEPISSHKILFYNMNGLGYGCNPKYIAEKLIELDDKGTLDLVWVTDGTEYDLPNRFRSVQIGTLDYYREVATAHIWINNTRMLSDIRKRGEQFYIQVWHGAAPFKRVEKDVEHNLSKTYVSNAIHDSQLADLFVSGSRFYTELYRKSFWYDGDILEVGLPRQDIFWNIEQIRKKVRAYFGIAEDVLLVMYSPTFRNITNMSIYNIDFDILMSTIEKKFLKKAVLLVSKHPSNRKNNYQFNSDVDFIDVAEYEDFEELLAATDILISDYSGCVYDFSFTKKPVFLYQNDYDEYIKDRGFYTPVSELPYITAKTTLELCDKIEKFNNEKYINALSAFMDKLGNFDRGNASEIIAKRIIEICKN